MKRKLQLLAVDLLLVFAATCGAFFIRYNGHWPENVFVSILPYVWASIGVSAIVFFAFGVNRTIWRYHSNADFITIAVAVAISILSAIAVTFATNRLQSVPRTLPVIQAMLTVLFMVGVRVAYRHYRDRRAFGSKPADASPLMFDQRNVVLVAGLDGICEHFLDHVKATRSGSVVIAGLMGTNERATGRVVHQHKVLGTTENVAGIVASLEVHGLFVDRVVVTTEFSKLSQAARSALLDLEKSTNIKIELLADQFDHLVRWDSKAGVETSAGSNPGTANSRRNSKANAQAAGLSAGPLNDVDEQPEVANRPYWHVKRAGDVLLSVVLIGLCAPLMALVALAVAVDVGRPVVFWQYRPGKAGAALKIYKFRTMSPPHDSHGRRIPDERRVSPIGWFLRRTRLDELPQLFSILTGGMSFVGPRPLLMVDQNETGLTRLKVRPGLTGWAQVKGGRDATVDDKMALDNWYVEHASLWLDFKIMLLTVPIVLFGDRSSESAVQTARELRDGKVEASAAEAQSASVTAEVESQPVTTEVNRASDASRLTVVARGNPPPRKAAHYPEKTAV